VKVKSVLKVVAEGDVDEKAKAEVKIQGKKSTQVIIDEAFAKKEDKDESK
jgi:hypothetical protein